MSDYKNDDFSSDDEVNDELLINSDIESDNDDDMPTDNVSSKKDKDQDVPDLDNDDNINDYVDDDESEDDETYDYQSDDLDGDLSENEETNNQNYIEDIINFNQNENVSNKNDSKHEIIIKPENRITSNIISMYEYIELISIRATQISNGSFIFTSVKGINDPLQMAEKEVFDNRCPLYIKRHIGMNKYELWSPNVMSKPKM
jgi:DNA-directed RNA polymerase subunit K/omega